ncbi:hypothetical protein CPB84DRAFT_1742262 [Gymnopilus junonius]|uniref:CxC1-like cysteine cluster associated with KDZ transposases domain-containing protein n=1 Tax=Gymnopilus junonius TaxID=109634 RepID=A0A9P5P1I9_GYMJU|nr:hypothetical protein CPB84DRAFT_1742262 [Gymnopilus junonius]
MNPAGCSKDLDDPMSSQGPDDEWEDIEPHSNNTSPEVNPANRQDTVDKTAKMMSSAKKKCITPDQAAITLYAKWKALLPMLLELLLQYTFGTMGKPLQPLSTKLNGACSHDTVLCERKENFLTVNITYCECHNLSQTLVWHGLFPTAPEQVHMAVSINFLDFYSTLFEHSCDAVNAMATALNTFYNRQGYFLVNVKHYSSEFNRVIDIGNPSTGDWVMLLNGLTALMCQLRLGLKALTLAWLDLALAFPNLEPGQKPKIRLGLARLWPKLGLLPYTKKYCVKLEMCLRRKVMKVLIKIGTQLDVSDAHQTGCTTSSKPSQISN